MYMDPLEKNKLENSIENKVISCLSFWNEIGKVLQYTAFMNFPLHSFYNVTQLEF